MLMRSSCSEGTAGGVGKGTLGQNTDSEQISQEHVLPSWQQLPGDLADADKKTMGRVMEKKPGEETWAFQARPTGLSEHSSQENVPQSQPQIEAFWLLAARHPVRHEGKGTLQKNL